MVGEPGTVKTGETLSWLLKSYGLEVQSYEKRDGLWRVECGQGVFAVREYDGDSDRLGTALAWQHFLAEKGCQGVPKIIRTKDGQNWARVDGKSCYLTGWVDKKEFNPEKGDHLLAAIEQLGHIHRLSRDFSPEKLSGFHNEMPWATVIQGRLSELLAHARHLQAGRLRTDVERVFIENFNQLYQQGQEALQGLVVGGYDAKLRENDQLLVNSFLKHKMGVINEGVVYTDLTRWTLGPPFMDLVLFLNSFLVLHKWDSSLVFRLLETYEKNNALDQEERTLLVLLLRLPWRFWLYVHQYFNHMESPAVLTEKMSSYINEIYWRDRCLDCLDDWVWREKE
ncbi:MAG: hypothetical protein QHH10_00115 [Peptococcaceae bacterium]|jgi:CotS family spore coat protein|nr:hypothetical protein [Peptococcaceae bacterium]MDH7523708.1 hypothetical protein [Peptococcaceae bacterium]